MVSVIFLREVLYVEVTWGIAIVLMAFCATDPTSIYNIQAFKLSQKPVMN